MAGALPIAVPWVGGRDLLGRRPREGRAPPLRCLRRLRRRNPAATDICATPNRHAALWADKRWNMTHMDELHAHRNHALATCAIRQSVDSAPPRWPPAPARRRLTNFKLLPPCPQRPPHTAPPASAASPPSSPTSAVFKISTASGAWSRVEVGAGNPEPTGPMLARGRQDRLPRKAKRPQVAPRPQRPPRPSTRTCVCPGSISRGLCARPRTRGACGRGDIGQPEFHPSMSLARLGPRRGSVFLGLRERARGLRAARSTERQRGSVFLARILTRPAPDPTTPLGTLASSWPSVSQRRLFVELRPLGKVGFTEVGPAKSVPPDQHHPPDTPTLETSSCPLCPSSSYTCHASGSKCGGPRRPRPRRARADRYVLLYDGGPARARRTYHAKRKNDEGQAPAARLVVELSLGRCALMTSGSGLCANLSGLLRGSLLSMLGYGGQLLLEGR